MELKDFDHHCNLEQMEHSHTHHQYLHHHETPPPPSAEYHPPPPPPSYTYVTNIITVPSMCCRCVDHCHSAAATHQLSGKTWVKAFSMAHSGYNLTIKHGKLVLAPSDPNDEYQHWYKEDKFTRSVKDKEGFSSFFLVNKATGQTFKNCTGVTHPLQLVPFKPDDNLDECLLLSESNDVRQGFKAIRMCNNIRLNLDAFGGDAGIYDGISMCLWEWNSGDNQIFKILPFRS